MKMNPMYVSGRGPVAMVLLVVLLATAACGTRGSAPAATTDGRVTIVAAFYPFQFLAERVAGEDGSVVNLTQPGAEPHDLELTPQQVGSLSGADLVVYERGFQPAVDEAVEQSGQAEVMDVASVVPLADLGTETEDESDRGHAHLDPHVWLDPQQMVTLARALADRLAALDPDHREAYAANSARLTSDLTALDREFASGLDSCQRTHFVTQHAAFGYLARRYGLTQISISGLSPDTEPSPARIAAVQREARRVGATTIFYETLVSPSVAKSIAGDLKLRTDVLDPVEGITPQSKGQDYLAVMRANLTALSAAGGCR